MVVFRDIQDVIEWLAPMSYVELWEAVEPYLVFSDEERDHCDTLISTGKVTAESILEGLKSMATVAIRGKLGLDERRHSYFAGDAGGLLH